MDIEQILEEDEDHCQCARCKKLFHIDDLDSKPQSMARFGWFIRWLLKILPRKVTSNLLYNAASHGEDFDVLECEKCYGKQFASAAIWDNIMFSDSVEGVSFALKMERGAVKYAKVGGPPEFWNTLRVFWNGVEQIEILEVNVEEGWAIRFKRDELNRLIVTDDEFETERVEGEFRIEIRE